MYPILPCLLAFGIAIAIDYVYANWMLSVSNERKIRACLYSALCSLLGSVAVWVFIDSWITCLPFALGHALGTFLAMTDHRRLREAERKMRDYDDLPYGPDA